MESYRINHPGPNRTDFYTEYEVMCIVRRELRSVDDIGLPWLWLVEYRNLTPDKVARVDSLVKESNVLFKSKTDGKTHIEVGHLQACPDIETVKKSREWMNQIKKAIYR